MPSAYYTDGKTPKGDVRYQCKSCKRTFSVGSPTRRQSETTENTLILKLLVDAVGLRRIMEIADIPASRLYHRIEFLAVQCRAMAAHKDRGLARKLEGRNIALSTDVQTILANWLRADRILNVPVLHAVTVERDSGYVAHRLDGRAKAMVVTSSRPAAVRYKKAFDAFIAANPAYKDIHALVAFSGKLTGREVMHPNDDNLQDDTFVVDEDAEFTEANMNPGAPNPDLRITFDRPEYRVMLVANKFQTGFDQPKLVAMYLDKKIANAVDIVQTLSRLNRIFPGKDEVFIIDFVNDPETVQAAFKQYDAGAKIEQVQDLNVIYDMKEHLDAEGIYDESHIEPFKKARHQTAHAIARDDATEHKAMFAATQEPTDTFNTHLKSLRSRADEAEKLFETSRATGNQDLMKMADHDRQQIDTAITQMNDFRSGLTRFFRAYSYIAQLVDLGDPDLENFAAFSKLLGNRLDGIPPQNVDLRGITLTGYDLKPGEPISQGETNEEPRLQPIGPGGSPNPGPMPLFLQEIIERLNSLFGEAAPLADQAAFVNHVASIAGESDVVMAQIEKNPKEQALKGNLPGAVQTAVVRAMTSHDALATMLLKEDRQGLGILTNMIYEMLKSGNNIDIDGLNG